MKSIRMWMGHSDFSTTADLYAHTDFTAKLQSAEMIEQALRGVVKTQEETPQPEG